jgi:hypothetical protein
MGRIARADHLPRGFVRRRRLLAAVVGGQLPVTLLVVLATNAALAQHRWPGWDGCDLGAGASGRVSDLAGAGRPG